MVTTCFFDIWNLNLIQIAYNIKSIFSKWSQKASQTNSPSPTNQATKRTSYSTIIAGSTMNKIPLSCLSRSLMFYHFSLSLSSQYLFYSICLTHLNLNKGWRMLSCLIYVFKMLKHWSNTSNLRWKRNILSWLPQPVWLTISERSLSIVIRSKSSISKNPKIANSIAGNFN